MGIYRIPLDELEDEIIGLMEDLEGDYTLADFLKAARNAWTYMKKREKD